jgi:hypothetical protein
MLRIAVGLIDLHCISLSTSSRIQPYYLLVVFFFFLSLLGSTEDEVLVDIIRARSCGDVVCVARVGREEGPGKRDLGGYRVGYDVCRLRCEQLDLLTFI